MAEAPRVAQLRDEFSPFGVEVVGVTSADRADAEWYVNDAGGRYPVLANAAADRDLWGVGFVWGSIFYLVDPTGNIVVDGLDGAELRLRSEFAAELEALQQAEPTMAP